MHRPLVILASAAAALGLAPAAHAVTRTTYEVELEGSYRYSIASRHVESGFQRTTDVGTKGTFTSDVGRLSFLDGRMDPGPDGWSRADLGVAFSSLGNMVEEESDEFGHDNSRTCVVDDAAPHVAQGYVQESELQPATSQTTYMNLRIADFIVVPFRATDRCSPFSGPVIGSDKEATLGRLDAEFELPGAATRAGKTIQLVSGPKHEPCPGSESPEVTKCSFDWDAKVTLTRVSVQELPQAGPRAPGDGLTPEIAPSLAGAPAVIKGKHISFVATCPVGCAGGALLPLRGKGPAPQHNWRFAVKPGTHTVRLRLPISARKRLRPGRRGRLRVRLVPSTNDTAVERTLAVRVRR